MNISESSMKNSSRTVDCPECVGKACGVCKGSGQVTISKLNRLKKDVEVSS